MFNDREIENRHLKLFESKLISHQHQLNHKRNQQIQHEKLYTFKLRNNDENKNKLGFNYFDNSILFKKQNRSRSRVKKTLNDDDWLMTNVKNSKQNDFEMLKDLLYSPVVNDNKVTSRNPSTYRNSSSASSSDDSNKYYRNRPIEFLDENVFFEENRSQPIKQMNVVEVVSNEECQDGQTIESLIEELNKELKRSPESSPCSSPNLVRRNSKNSCACEFSCKCRCHLNRFSILRFSSNSSSVNSRNSSSQVQSNSPFSVRRISHESLEWDISLDKINSLNDVSNSSPLDKSECTSDKFNPWF